MASLSFPFMLFSNTYSAIFVARLRMEYAAAGAVAQSLTSLTLMGAVAATERRHHSDARGVRPRIPGEQRRVPVLRAQVRPAVVLA